MAIPRRIPIRFEDVFPFGAYVVSVDAVTNYERRNEPDSQDRDKETGERMWAVRVIDADPAAKKSELTVKIVGPVMPVPPEAMPGTPFRPVEFDGLVLIPWIKDERLQWALRATAMRPVAGANSSRRAGAVAA